MRDLISLDLRSGLPGVRLDGCFVSISSAAAADCDFINMTPEVTGSGSLSATTYMRGKITSRTSSLSEALGVFFFLHSDYLFIKN